MKRTALAVACTVLLAGGAALASSHREAPLSSNASLNVVETYTVDLIRPGKGTTHLVIAATGQRLFVKPHDSIGTKSVADYATYANRYISHFQSWPCGGGGRVFVGQRREGFAVRVGEIFDLIHLNPVGAPNANQNDLYDKHVTSIALELPIGCLTRGSSIVGAWTTASTWQDGAWKQVSRLSAPLVNEVVIGLPDKERFNASRPRDDAQFAKYVTNPALPELPPRRAALVAGSTLAVTLEPEAGVRHAAPTGPIIAKGGIVRI